VSETHRRGDGARDDARVLAYTGLPERARLRPATRSIGRRTHLPLRRIRGRGAPDSASSNRKNSDISRFCRRVE
jgi:hypothetical protein